MCSEASARIPSAARSASNGHMLGSILSLAPLILSASPCAAPGGAIAILVAGHDQGRAAHEAAGRRPSPTPRPRRICAKPSGSWRMMAFADERLRAADCRPWSTTRVRPPRPHPRCAIMPLRRASARAVPQALAGGVARARRSGRTGSGSSPIRTRRRRDAGTPASPSNAPTRCAARAADPLHDVAQRSRTNKSIVSAERTGAATGRRPGNRAGCSESR